MPSLKSIYKQAEKTDKTKTTFRSKQSLTTELRAKKNHKQNGYKLINYGGHGRYGYAWRGVTRIKLLPTLTSTLLLSFSLASIVRYRPTLLHNAINSPVSLLIDVFTTEVDDLFIPSLRNMLYCEETTFSQAVGT